MSVRGVLLDWRGTLAVTVPWSRWIERALRRVGNGDPDPVEVRRVGAALDDALALPGVRSTWSRHDISAEVHRTGHDIWFRAAGIPADLAAALYAEESDPARNPFAADVRPTLAALDGSGLAVAIVSDIHFDLRPRFVAAGLDDFVDAYVLSFEHGTQKPDASFFRLALEALGVHAGEALMVGDRSTHDGAAVEAGIPTLLLPPLTGVDDERLHLVLATCGVTR
jgi:HAD superfamily hydrolase (TIGR01509 family)